MLVYSEDPGDILDNLHSAADINHLISERCEHMKRQQAMFLTKDPHDNISSTNSQNSVNCVNHEPIKVDSWTREQPRTYVQEEMKYQSIEHSIPSVSENAGHQNIKNQTTTKLPDVPHQVAIEKEIEEECTNEVVSYVPPPRVYSANVTIQTDIEKEMPITEIYEVVELPDKPVQVIEEQEIEETIKRKNVYEKLMT